MMDQEEGHSSSSSSSAPLLEKKTGVGGGGGAGAGGGGMYYCEEGCPGCAVDRRKAANPGIPYGSFIYVWIVTLCTGDRRTSLARNRPLCFCFFAFACLLFFCSFVIYHSLTSH
jgi:hypothetical protein